jgi:hypothetical protein
VDSWIERNKLNSSFKKICTHKDFLETEQFHNPSTEFNHLTKFLKHCG